MPTNSERILENTARINAITERLAKSKFSDVSDTTATAGDVAVGKVFYNAQGIRTEGTGNLSIGTDMLQARVDATNSCDYLFYNYAGDDVDYIANLDLSKVIKATSMFESANKIKTIPPLNTTSLINANKMFYNSSSLETIPQLDTSNVTDPRNMHYNCRALKNVPQYNFEKANNINHCFYNCESITELPYLNTKYAKSFESCVCNCTSLTTIGLNLVSATTLKWIVEGCTNLTNLTLKNIKKTLQIGSGTTWGHLLTLDSLLNTIKELWDMSSSSQLTLTIGSANLEKLANVYVKLVDVTDEMRAEDEYIDNKKPFVVCESTDEGAMSIAEYVTSKNWQLA